ncbi:MAG: hypothetical protein ACK8QZ_03905, partial [Anaerolineales bacterium]
MSIPPTLAYLALMGSIFLSLVALLSPGTGVLELVALLGWIFTGYAVYQLGITLWALFLLLLSVFPFFYALRQQGRKRHIFFAAALVGMVIGSVFLFPNAEGTFWPPAVDPWVAALVALFFVSGSWFAAQKIRQVMV